MIVILVVVLVFLVALILRLPNADSEQAAAPVPIRGADISFTLQEEAVNQQVRNGAQVQPIEEILSAHGANYARLRLWVSPLAGTSDLASALILAARARKAGLKLLLDLHYSDSWADRTTQTTPTEWQGLSPEDLSRTVENYTRDVVTEFARQDTPVDIVQVGNEVANGMLWPTGQLNESWGENWFPFINLLKAGAKGARDANPAHRPPS